MKNRYFYFLFMVIFFILTSCVNRSLNINQAEVPHTNLISLLELGENYKENHQSLDSIKNLLNKILINQEEKEFVLILDSVAKEESIIKNYKITSDVNVLRDLYVFSVCVLNKDTLVVNGKYSKLCNLDEQIRVYYDEIIKEGYTKRILNEPIDFFETKETFEINFLLNADMSSGKGLSLKEWKLFFECLHTLNLIKEEIRNKVAIKYLGRSFNDLDSSEKNSHFNFLLFSTVLSFEMKCKLMQPPTRVDL